MVIKKNLKATLPRYCLVFEIGSIRETLEIQMCRVVPKGLNVTLQMPHSAAFARVVFLSSKGTFVFDLLELKALNI